MEIWVCYWDCTGGMLLLEGGDVDGGGSVNDEGVTEGSSSVTTLFSSRTSNLGGLALAAASKA